MDRPGHLRPSGWDRHRRHRGELPGHRRRRRDSGGGAYDCACLDRHPGRTVPASGKACGEARVVPAEKPTVGRHLLAGTERLAVKVEAGEIELAGEIVRFASVAAASRAAASEDPSLGHPGPAGAAGIVR